MQRQEERQEEEVTEETRRLMMQEMARRFSSFEEALLVFEVWGPSVEWYTKFATAVQNAVQCYSVICDKKKENYLPRHHWIVFSTG